MTKREKLGTTRLLHEAFRSLREAGLEDLRERGYEGITLAHLRVLQHVVFTGGSLSEIARAASISRQAVAKVAADLEGLGYLRLSPSPEDRRAYVAELTPAGSKLFQMVRKRVDAGEVRLARLLGKERLAELRAMLVEIAESW